MREGFAFVAGLLLFGIVLQVALGPVRWEALAWPVNIFVLAAWLVLVGVFYALRRRVRFFEWMMHNGAGVPALVFALVLTLVMGLVTQGDPGRIPPAMADSLAAAGMPQAASAGATMPWLGRMLRFWPFALAWGWVVIISALAALNHLLRWEWRQIPFVLNHLGVAVAITAAALGAPDKQDLRLMAFAGTPEWRAVDGNGQLVELGFSVTLNDFIMETYPDGTPKRFASEVTVVPGSGGVPAGGEHVEGTIEVNRPLRFGGWRIYQHDYDKLSGKYSVLELMRDPWLWAVYVGIFMMLAGAVCLMLFMAPKPVRDESDEGSGHGKDRRETV